MLGGALISTIEFIFFSAVVFASAAVAETQRQHVVQLLLFFVVLIALGMVPDAIRRRYEKSRESHEAIPSWLRSLERIRRYVANEPADNSRVRS